MENNTSSNRRLFAEIVLPTFVCAYTHNGSVTHVYEQFIEKLNSDTNPTHRAKNEERRKILENCRDLFKDIPTKKDIDKEIELIRAETNKDMGRDPSFQEISKKLLQSCPNLILGDKKRKYDMSDKNIPGLIAKANNGKRVVLFKPSDELNWVFDDGIGTEIVLQKEGRLAYRNGIGQTGDIDKFKITLSRGENDSQEYYVFTRIDTEKLGDPLYCKLLVRELLGKNNIELSNAGGYIGEIIDSSYERPKLKVGEEFESDTGFYRYQVAPNYSLMYDYEILSAVMAYNEELEKIQKIDGR